MDDKKEAIFQLQDLRSHCKDFSEEGSVWQKDIEALDMAIKALQEWILCSERLPKTKGNYLVTVTDCDGVHIEIGCFDPEDSYDVDFWSTGVDIVAWMPLPEPWGGVEDEIYTNK